MTTSGTYAFSPANADLVTYAFSLCGIRRTEILQEHLVNANMAMNLMLQAWGNETPNLWTVDEVVQTLVPGVRTYNVDPKTIMVLDAFVRWTDDSGTLSDRIIWPVSRTEYASYPNKQLLGLPTTFWFDRQLAPTITLWPVPNGQGATELRYYRCVQIQDAAMTGAQTTDIPLLWLEAFAYGLASRIALIYVPERHPGLDALAERAWNRAATQNVENVPLFIGPQLGGYYR
jgi:hypothetical protein